MELLNDERLEMDRVIPRVTDGQKEEPKKVDSVIIDGQLSFDLQDTSPGNLSSLTQENNQINLLKYVQEPLMLTDIEPLMESHGSEANENSLTECRKNCTDVQSPELNQQVLTTIETTDKNLLKNEDLIESVDSDLFHNQYDFEYDVVNIEVSSSLIETELPEKKEEITVKNLPMVKKDDDYFLKLYNIKPCWVPIMALRNLDMLAFKLPKTFSRILIKGQTVTPPVKRLVSEPCTRGRVQDIGVKGKSNRVSKPLRNKRKRKKRNPYLWI